MSTDKTGLPHNNQVQSTLESVKGQATDTVSQLADDVKKEVSRREKSIRGSLAGSADDIASALRKAKSDLDPDSAIAPMLDSAAESVGGIADSLNKADTAEMINGIRNFARERPGAFLGLSAIAGFAAARFLLASTPRGASRSTSSYGGPSYGGSSYGGSSYGGSGSSAMSGSTGSGSGSSSTSSGGSGMGKSSPASGGSGMGSTGGTGGSSMGQSGGTGAGSAGSAGSSSGTQASYPASYGASGSTSTTGGGLGTGAGVGGTGGSSGNPDATRGSGTGGSSGGMGSSGGTGTTGSSGTSSPGLGSSTINRPDGGRHD
ncbi:MAG: hypothetical protein FJX25_08835 [Alphaproteobacteria bacterium]|nr:hypothetical protein [Alphaproteobacteria bacterium]